MPRRERRIRSALDRARRLLYVDVAEAERRAESLLQSLHDHELDMRADAISILALVEENRGNLSKSIALLEEASFEKLSPLAHGRLLSQWAVLLAEKELYMPALDKAAFSLGLIEASSPGSSDHVRALLTRAIVNRKLERYEESLLDACRALSLNHPKKDPHSNISALNELALVCLAVGTRESTEITLRNLDQCRKNMRRFHVPAQSVHGAMVSWVEGLLQEKAGDLARGLRRVREARDILGSVGGHLIQEFQASADMAMILLKMRRWSKLIYLLAGMIVSAGKIEVDPKIVRDLETLKSMAVDRQLTTERLICLVKAVNPQRIVKCHKAAKALAVKREGVSEDSGPIGF